MAQLCLGTVQFGMEYGINNKYGQPSLKECFEMFDIAIDSGIEKFDTATAYGVAEEILGKYILNNHNSKNMKIISKLKPNVLDYEKGTPQQIVRQQVVKSLERMHIDILDGYLLHTPEYVYNTGIMEGMQRIKEEGLVSNIGVSIYDMKEGMAAIDTGLVDYIQLPYSVFDQRGMASDFLEKAKKKHITIYCRSAFLQGLIIMKEEEIPNHLHEAKMYIQIFNQLLKKYEVDVRDGLIHFVSDNQFVDYLVFGVDTKEQLLYNVESFNNVTVPKEFICEVKEKLQNVNKSIIFPSLWKKN